MVWVESGRIAKLIRKQMASEASLTRMAISALLSKPALTKFKEMIAKLDED